MQVLCMVTANTDCDVQCPCCSQRYIVYFSRQCKAECDEALESVRLALIAHHVSNPLASAHPGDAFNLPPWNGPVHASAAALLGGAPLRLPRSRPAPLAFVQSVRQRRVSAG